MENTEAESHVLAVNMPLAGLWRSQPQSVGLRFLVYEIKALKEIIPNNFHGLQRYIFILTPLDDNLGNRGILLPTSRAVKDGNYT